MLFLGTKKYPVENHYAQFIKSHGGLKNAATGEDYTFYHFDIKNEQFNEALDIFSQFFKEPLFTESATEREMNAVDNEFRRNLSNEARRKFQIEKTELACKAGPLNKFSTGNLESLNIPDIREKLLKYYDDHYSANLMSLCLVGNHSIDTLEALAIEHFSAIENKDLELRDFKKEIESEGGAPLYDENTLGHMVKIVPIKDVRSLTIKWPQLPDTRLYWDSNPLSYISHVIGHEGKNSLLSELIK